MYKKPVHTNNPVWSRKFLLSVVWLFLSFFSFAQKFHFERFTVESGLQNNIVFASAQDAKGMMWFAGSTGIDRFDGNKFVRYLLPQRNNTFTAYSHIPFLLTDSKNQLWAASASSIFLYNSRRDVFELPATVNKWIEKNRNVTSFNTGNDKKLLLAGNNNGFFVFNPETDKIFSPADFNQYVRYIYQDNKGMLWVGSNKGLYRFIFDGSTINEYKTEIPVLSAISALTVSGISQDRQGRYWIMTTDKGLFVYDELYGRLDEVVLPRSSTQYFYVKDVYHDKNGLSYVSTDGGGVVVVNSNLQVLETYLTNEDDVSSLSSNAAYDIFSDRYDRLWVTTYGGGVNMVKPSVQPFRNFTHEINNSNSLSNNAAKAVTEDGSGNIWFGTRKGISVYNPGTSSWRHINEESHAPAYSSDNVLSLSGDGSSNIWAGTYGGGMIYINAVTGQIKSYTTVAADSSSIGTDYVYAVLEDSKKRVWAGGIRGSISYLDVNSNRFTRLKTPVSSVNCIIENSKGQLLFGTEKGVFTVSGDSITNFFPQAVTDKVLSLLEYSPGIYWVGTLGGGITVVSSDNKTAQKFKTQDGLPADVVGALLKDKNGDVWVGTSRGIAHYRQQEKTFTAYTKADGLAGSQVNYEAAYQTRSGEMIFGTTDGFSMFNPKDIRIKGFKPVIVLTGLTVNNKQLRAGDEDSPLTEQIDETGVLTLKYYQNSVTIDFVNTSPEVSGKHLYSWKLEGFDKDWSPASTIPAAVYTNLGTGRYTLLIKAFSKGQTENEVVRKVRIIIRSPWWKTTWAYTSYILLLIAVVYALFNFLKIRNTRRKYAERLKLNTSISHEIRTPLTLIKGPVTALATSGQLDEEQQTNLELARKNIEKLETIISQFIDFQKTGFDKMQMQVKRADIISLVDDVTASFIPLMKEKGIYFSYSKPSEKIEVLYDRDKMEKVLNNLLSNAVKYTPGKGDISVVLSKDAKYLSVQVSDSGIGIPENQQHLLFKGYFRADNTINVKETGSGIGLNVAKELVQMHHGKLSFKSDVGKGSSFIVRIPLVNPDLEQYLVKDDGYGRLNMPELATRSMSVSGNKKILIAEDNDELRNYLDKELSASGFTVLSAANGKEALAVMAKGKPDIVITDVMMPEMNGFQLCAAVKRDISTCHIPVIMLTAIHDKDYLLEGYRSGADDYVRKPFDLAYMITRIENLLQDRTRFRNKIMSVFEQDEATVKEDEDVRWLKTATGLIVEHISDSEFSVEKLCVMMVMSRSALFRKFKSITGESPQQYIIQVRLRRAVELLHQKTYNINEVAFEAGFSDPKYFSTAFKKHYGKSPSEYVQEG